jgi:hypothetical protein
MRICVRVFAVLLLAIGASGCALLPTVTDESAASAPVVPVRIAAVEGVYENIDSSFWAEGDARREYALFLNVWVHLAFDPQTRRVPVDVRLYDFLNNYWSLDVDASSVRDGEPLGGWVRLRDHFMSDNGAMLPLRGMRLYVELDDGSVTTAPVEFPSPATSSVDERFLVSEEYRGELTGDHAFALARAEVLDAAIGASSVRVVIGPTDRRATNGQVLLLAADRSLVGESEEFYNDISREPRPILNRGTRFRTDAENLIELPMSTIAWRAGRSEDDVRYVYVKLRDGGQFAFTERSRSYLHLSRSALASVRPLAAD